LDTSLPCREWFLAMNNRNAIRTLECLGIAIALVVPAPSASAADSCWTADSQLNFSVGDGGVGWTDEGISISEKTTLLDVGDAPTVTMCFYVGATKKYTSYVHVDGNTILTLGASFGAYSRCVEIERDEPFDPVEISITTSVPTNSLMLRLSAAWLPSEANPLPSRGATQIKLIKSCPPSSS
jgi:hypothetical protein